ncbi:hypothetical protein, partial [Clostridium perfringens]
VVSLSFVFLKILPLFSHNSPPLKKQPHAHCKANLARVAAVLPHEVGGSEKAAVERHAEVGREPAADFVVFLSFVFLKILPLFSHNSPS